MFVIGASFFNISRNFFFNMSRYGLYRIFPYNKIMVAAREEEVIIVDVVIIIIIVVS